jgi:hypothetical protein
MDKDSDRETGKVKTWGNKEKREERKMFDMYFSGRQPDLYVAPRLRMHGAIPQFLHTNE